MKPPRPPLPRQRLDPAPSRLEDPLRSERDVLTHRRLYCGHYDRCLDHSVQAGWEGFTCTRCPLRQYASDGPGAAPYAQLRRAEKLST